MLTSLDIRNIASYDVRDLSAQQVPSKFAGVVIEKLKVVLERCLLSKVFTVFHTAAVYSWIYTGKL